MATNLAKLISDVLVGKEIHLYEYTSKKCSPTYWLSEPEKYHKNDKIEKIIGKITKFEVDFSEWEGDFITVSFVKEDGTSSYFHVLSLTETLELV